MIHIDHYAYCSRLREIAPEQKMLFSLGGLLLCLVLNSPWVSAAVIAVMSVYSIRAGGVPTAFFLRLLLLPGSFLILGTATILVGVYPTAQGLLAAWPVGGVWLGVSAQGLTLAFGLFLKALGATACLYGLSLTTPLVAVLSVLRRLGLPALITDLMGLIYRFVFVLLDSAGAIMTAQQARLGYAGAAAAYRSFGMMLTMLLVKALKHSDQVYTALEARGYQGELRVLEEEYRRSGALTAATVLLTAGLVLIGMAAGS